MSSTGLKATHDLLLAIKPGDVEHDAGECPLCQESDIHDDHPGGGSMSDKTFTEEELKAAVDKAVADATASLTAKVAELETSQQQSEMDKALSAVQAEKDEAIADLQAKLDAAVIEATQAKEAKTALEEFWATAIAEDEEKAAREARREERLAKLAEEAGFPEEYLKENADRFVAMSDEEFAARLEDYKAVAAKAPAGGEPPASTALTASRQTTSIKSSSLTALRELRSAGVDPRVVRS